MSPANKNFVLAYFFLVAVPLLGLLGILRQGRGLTAPISIDGNWKLQVDGDQSATLSCGGVSGSNQTLNISQSGERFMLNLGSGLKTAAFGILDGTKLSTSLLPVNPGAGPGGCGADQQWTLVATVDPSASPKTLAGVLSVDGCSSCTPIQIRAIHEMPAVKGAR